MSIAALLAGLFSGIAGAMGLGGGAVLIIYLDLIAHTDRLTAGGINLIFFIPTALCAVIIYAFKREIKWKIVLPFALFGLLGAAAGLWLAGVIGGKIIGKIFGGLLILAGLRETFSKSVENKKEK